MNHPPPPTAFGSYLFKNQMKVIILLPLILELTRLGETRLINTTERRDNQQIEQV